MTQPVRYAIIASADQTSANTTPSPSVEAPINVLVPVSVLARSVPQTARLRRHLLLKGRERRPAMPKKPPRIVDLSIRPPSELPISNTTATFA